MIPYPHQVDHWQQFLASLGSTLLGLAVFLLAARVLLIVDRHIRTFAEDWEFEQGRRIRLRNGSRVYRLTEPLIDELAQCRLVNAFGIERITVSLSRGGSALPWKAEEYVAVCLMESLLLLLGMLFFGSGLLTPVPCFLIGAGLAALYLRTTVRALHRSARQRVELIQKRLPFGIDLVALMMRAGAGFREALETVVAESGNHPFSMEFRQVLDDVKRGQTLHDSLDDLDRRLQSDQIREIVFAINKSEELGTPLAEIFANVADQMRQKKSQWAEAAAGKAQVQIQFPGFVIMLACLVTILAPFLFGLMGSSAVL